MAKQKKNNHSDIQPVPREAIAAVGCEEDFVELLLCELEWSAAQSLFENKERQPTRGGVLALSQLIQKTREKLAAADSAAWSAEEKNTARESLTGLMQEFGQPLTGCDWKANILFWFQRFLQ